MPPTLAPDVAARALSEVLDSPKAKKAAEKHGLKTLGDVVTRGGVGTLHGLAGFGEASIRLIEKAIGPAAVEHEAMDEEIEEGVHPIRLESPYPEFRFVVIPSRKVTEPGGGYSIQENAFVEFDRGDAVLTKNMFLLRKFNRDRAAVSEAMKKPEYPWRKEAVEWLRSMPSFVRGDFRVLAD